MHDVGLDVLENTRVMGDHEDAEVVALLGMIHSFRHDAQRIDVVPEITDDILRLAEGKGSELGTGGMKTKLSAAQIVTKAGTDMIIANGADVEQLYALLDGRAIGTRFTGKKADA